MPNNFDPPRRDFLKRTSGLVLGCLASASMLPGTEPELTNSVGYATISWPKNELDRALHTISDLGYQGVQVLGWVRGAYPDGHALELRDELDRLHLQPAVLSCSSVKLNPLDLTEVNEGFEADTLFFRQLRGKFLQVTDGGHPDASYTADQVKALGKSMNDLGKIAQDAGLTLGYHPHVGTLGETRQGLGRVLDSTDPRYVKLIADVAHLTLGGSDPAEVIRTYHERLVVCHFKDVRKDAADLYRENPAAARHAKYRFCEVGQGVVDFPAIIKAFRDAPFNGWVIVELDSYQPPPGGPGESARVNKVAIEKLGLRI